MVVVSPARHTTKVEIPPFPITTVVVKDHTPLGDDLGLMIYFISDLYVEGTPDE